MGGEWGFSVLPDNPVDPDGLGAVRSGVDPVYVVVRHLVGGESVG